MKNVSEINKVPHDYRSPVFNWSDDNSTCSVSKICATCGYEQNLTVQTTSEITRQATCSTPGEVTYTADFGGGLVTSKTVTTSTNSSAHNMSGIDITWSDDCSKCIVTIYCVNPGCSESFVEEGSVELVEYREPTCNSDGIKIYKATFESGLVDQTKEIVLPATGEHNLDYENVVYVWNND